MPCSSRFVGLIGLIILAWITHRDRPRYIYIISLHKFYVSVFGNVVEICSQSVSYLICRKGNFNDISWSRISMQVPELLWGFKLWSGCRYRQLVVTLLLTEIWQEIFCVCQRWQYGYTSGIVNICFYRIAYVCICMSFDRLCTVCRQVMYSCDSYYICIKFCMIKSVTSVMARSGQVLWFKWNEIKFLMSITFLLNSPHVCINHFIWYSVSDKYTF